MCKHMFALLALTISLFGTQCWAGTCFPGEEGVSCTNTFTPTSTTNTYDFSSSGDGVLVVQFDTVLTTFTLTVTVDHNIDPIDSSVFPTGTVCVHYASGPCDEYDFTGSAGGPNGVPVKNVDYKRLITLTLSYLTNQTAHNPAFGHAPGDNATAVYNEDILTSYSNFPLNNDPTMGGKLPGLSSVAAFDELLEETDCFVFVSPTDLQTFTRGQEIEVEFQLFNSTCAGKPIRDKDARLSLLTFDSNGQPVFVPVGKDEGGKHFHFDHDEGVNEREVDTEGLQPGTYYITVFSSEFSPQTRRVVIQ